MVVTSSIPVPALGRICWRCTGRHGEDGYFGRRPTPERGRSCGSADGLEPQPPVLARYRSQEQMLEQLNRVYGDEPAPAERRDTARMKATFRATIKDKWWVKSVKGEVWRGGNVGNLRPIVDRLQPACLLQRD